ncbi:hypothetical protein [Methanobrevibacter sp.]
MNKVLAVGAIIAVAFIALFAYYSLNENEGAEKTYLTVYADFPMNITGFIHELETHSYYKGHNGTTVSWLKTLDEKNVVFSGNDTYVVMGISDFKKIPVESATDVFITDTFKCHVKEKRPLGNNLSDVVYVGDVEFVKQDIEYMDV